jgi:serine/threonine-protein phosphatase 5
MATLLTASQKPSNLKSEGSQPAILSPEGKKRYFVVHGGLFSKDGVTLDDVKNIQRYGKQPGQEGLMCEVGLWKQRDRFGYLTLVWSQLLWTDPQDAPGRGPSKRVSSTEHGSFELLLISDMSPLRVSVSVSVPT